MEIFCPCGGPLCSDISFLPQQKEEANVKPTRGEKAGKKAKVYLSLSGIVLAFSEKKKYAKRLPFS